MPVMLDPDRIRAASTHTNYSVTVPAHFTRADALRQDHLWWLCKDASPDDRFTIRHASGCFLIVGRIIELDEIEGEVKWEPIVDEMCN